MENNLPVIKIYRMDYSFLIKNYLNPEMWKKEWTLFEYKNFKITMNIWSIQTRNEQILLDIKVHYVNENGYSEYKEKTISFSLKIDDVTFLKRQINSAIFDTMVSIERELYIMKTDYYYELKRMKREEEYKLTEIAEKFLDESGVTNDNLRDAYIEAYVNEYSKTPNMISDYVSSRIYKEIPDLYLTWLSCLEDDPKKEIRTKEIQKALDDSTYEEIMKEVEEYKEHMQTEEYTEEMQDKLEEV